MNKDMSKGDFQKILGISPSVMTKLHRGEKNVFMEVLQRICNCLGCNIDDIAEFVDECK